MDEMELRSEIYKSLTAHLNPFILEELESTIWTRLFGLKFDILELFKV
jgi:hypothetical protein